MWDQPREGTEAYLVKREAERRQKLAKDKKLDQLLIDAYTECIKFYPAWKKNQNKKYVHPAVSEAKALGGEHSNDFQFKMGEVTYKVTRGDRWTPEFGEGTWYELTLFVDGKKVFAVTEEETHDEYSSYHRPVFVKAFVDDTWANDFKEILAHNKKVHDQASIEYAENPELTRKLKEDFGITEVPSRSISNNPALREEDPEGKSIWSKWWVWVIIILAVWSWLSS